VPPDFVFTYGTLRPSLATGTAARLIAGLEIAGPAVVYGRLFDLGPYPGLVAGQGRVSGDLLRVPEGPRLGALDAFEGCGGSNPLYRREAWRATRPDGSDVAAWVYVYARALAGARPIESGDYQRHLGLSENGPTPGEIRGTG
jgi:gamma-glutamylcyclotransferase (GGCT)/AIG2-like uncharacterized protein YtfP